MRSSIAKLTALAAANIFLTLLNVWLGRSTRRLGKALMNLQQSAGAAEEVGIYCKTGQKTATLALELNALTPPHLAALDYSRRFTQLVYLRRADCDLVCWAVGVSCAGRSVRFDCEVFLMGRRLRPVNTAGDHHLTLFQAPDTQFAEQVAEELEAAMPMWPFEIGLGPHCAARPLLTQTSRLARLPCEVHRAVLGLQASRELSWHKNTDDGRKRHLAL